MPSVATPEFTGKRVLVTGGTKGTGSATVDLFRSRGARVATAARSTPPGGVNADLFVQADLTQPDSVQLLADAVTDLGHGVDERQAAEAAASPVIPKPKLILSSTGAKSLVSTPSLLNRAATF
mgnify:CR=1 FL=1